MTIVGSVQLSNKHARGNGIGKKNSKSHCKQSCNESYRNGKEGRQLGTGVLATRESARGTARAIAIITAARVIAMGKKGVEPPCVITTGKESWRS